MNARLGGGSLFGRSLDKLRVCSGFTAGSWGRLVAGTSGFGSGWTAVSGFAFVIEFRTPTALGVEVAEGTARASGSTVGAGWEGFAILTAIFERAASCNADGLLSWVALITICPSPNAAVK